MSLKNRQAGFSLLEVLVASIVFSIGVLGISSLNAVSKRSSLESVQRSMASQLSYALLEAMHANSQALGVFLAAGDLGGGSLGAEPALTCDDADAPCTPVQIAAHSLWDWEQSLDGSRETRGGEAVGGLVSPTACINGPAAAGVGFYTVTIAWRSGTEMLGNVANNCGAGSGLYGAGDEFRRTVVLQSFIDPTI